MGQDGVSRRYFFFGSLLAGAVPLAGQGSVPSLRALGYKPYYDKLNVASIGCGGQGGVDLNAASLTENIVALCDVDDARAAANFKKFEKAPKYKDFRAMLDKEGKNIDACTIGIPDFMHATVALACMQRGKHVYLEKPLTRTPWEGACCSRPLRSTRSRRRWVIRAFRTSAPVSRRRSFGRARSATSPKRISRPHRERTRQACRSRLQRTPCLARSIGKCGRAGLW